MEPTTDLPHLNYIFSMQEAEQKEYLKAVGQELTAHPIHHLSAEWGCFGAMDPNRTPDELARGLLSRMTLAEKVNQMSADIPPKYYKVLFPRYNCKPYYAGEDQRLEIPALKFTDGPTGIVSGYASTAFPVSMARGASFDPKLEERIGDAIGVEGRSAGANLFGGVCINLLRHPAWGPRPGDVRRGSLPGGADGRCSGARCTAAHDGLRQALCGQQYGKCAVSRGCADG
jgi:beta-glucosidase